MKAKRTRNIILENNIGGYEVYPVFLIETSISVKDIDRLNFYLRRKGYTDFSYQVNNHHYMVCVLFVERNGKVYLSQTNYRL